MNTIQSFEPSSFVISLFEKQLYSIDGLVLDEFPQFFNVLRGDMSIVGPRPIVQEELERFGPLGKDYIGVRPGLTGLWQIKGRRDNDYTHRAQMDAAYARNISFLRDIYIMFATVPEVLLARGR